MGGFIYNHCWTLRVFNHPNWGKKHYFNGGGSPGSTKPTISLRRSRCVKESYVPLSRAPTKTRRNGRAVWPCIYGGLTSSVHGGLAGIFGICNFPKCCLFIPESSKGLKFEPLNHQKQTWGLKFDTLGGSRFFWLFKIGSFPLLVTVLVIFLGYPAQSLTTIRGLWTVANNS